MGILHKRVNQVKFKSFLYIEWTNNEWIQSFLEDTCEDFKYGQKCCHFLKPFLTSVAVPASLCHASPEF